jgi:hypothetical protein
MSLVMGVDPGLNGAYSILDSADPHHVLDYGDMPTVDKTVGRSKRKRTDLVGVEMMVDTVNYIGVRLVVIEDTGVRPRQAGQKELGINIGILQYAFHHARVRTELIVPNVWKKALRAPADKDEAVNRAIELFPNSREIFFGPKGGRKDGRAEAAMIALYGCKNLL